MTFSDIFKKSFIEGFQGETITTQQMVVTLAISCFIALYMYWVYRLVTRKSFYNKSFNISLVAIAIITTSIILTIQASIVISLGMVGALSIVRFRTAVKDPLDLVFMFWAISTGLICGAGLAEIAVIASVILTIIIFSLSHIPVLNMPMILVINCNSADDEDVILPIVQRHCKHMTVKARNAVNDAYDVTIELRGNADNKLVKELNRLESVYSVALMTQEGESHF